MSLTNLPPDLEEAMKNCAVRLQEIFAPMKFALLLFDNSTENFKTNFITNGNIDQVILAMKEFIENLEGIGDNVEVKGFKIKKEH